MRSLAAVSATSEVVAAFEIVMPRFYFNLVIDGLSFPDPLGVEFHKGIDFGFDEWATVVRALLTDDDRKALDGGSFDITDETGQIIAVVPVKVRHLASILIWITLSGWASLQTHLGMLT